jgi:hypothetical protein
MNSKAPHTLHMNQRHLLSSVLLLQLSDELDIVLPSLILRLAFKRIPSIPLVLSLQQSQY